MQLRSIGDSLSDLMNDLARTLRDVGKWTNRHGDQYATIASRLKKLEDQAREIEPSPAVRRPFQTWADFDAVLKVLLAFGTGCEAGGCYQLSPSALLWLCRSSADWRERGYPVPKNLRVIQWGDIIVEWPKGHLMLSNGSVLPCGVTPLSLAA